MKRKRTLLLLSVVLAGICASIVGVKAVEKHVDSIQTFEETVIAVDPETLTEIKWTNENGTVDFVKNEDTWSSTDDEDFPVSADTMADFLSEFEDVKAGFIIEDVEDYEQYGLSSPEHTLTLVNGEDTTVITTGAFSTMDEKRYICVDSGTVYLVETDIAEFLEYDRDHFLDNDQIPYFYQVKELKLTGNETLEIIYDADGEYVYTQNYDYYLKDGDSYKALSTTKINSFLALFTNETYDDYETYKASEEDLASFGFDDPTLSIFVKGDRYSEYTKEQMTDEIEEAEYTIDFVQKDEETIYMHVQGSSIIYKFDAETYGKLSEACFNTLRPTEVVNIEEKLLSEISAEIDGVAYSILVNTDDDKTTYLIGEEEVDASQLVDDIESLSVAEFTDDQDETTLEFKVNLVYDGQTLEIRFYRVDGDSCLVTFNGEQIGLIDRSKVITVQEDFNTLVLNLGKEKTEE